MRIAHVAAVLRRFSCSRPPSSSLRTGARARTQPHVFVNRTRLAFVGVGVLLCDSDYQTQTRAPARSSQIQKQPPAEESIVARKHIQSVVQALLEHLATILRALSLFVQFAPVFASAPLVLPQLFFSHELASTRLWYKILVHQMERAGPTFVKLAQWAGSRTDLFPPSLCSAFGRLHSHGRAHAYSYTRAALESAFDAPVDSVLAHIDPVPVGVGSVAQVYRARLHTGQSVAIKVIHPHARTQVARDLRIMSWGAYMLSWGSWQWLSLPDEVEWFSHMMFSQLNLRKEAANLDTFIHNFASREGIVFPAPFHHLTTENVLVEQYIDGIPLAYFLRRACQRQDQGVQPTSYDRRLARLGLNAFLDMLLLDNFVHADLHPGNIYVCLSPYRKNNHHNTVAQQANTTQALLSLKDDPQGWDTAIDNLHDHGWQLSLAFIDTGLAATLTGTNQRNFIDLFGAIASFDGYKAGHLMVERSATPSSVIEPDKFATDVGELVDRVRVQTFHLDGIVIGDVLANILGAARRHHVRLEGEFVNVVLSTLILEGVGRTLDGDLDLFEAARPVLRRLGRRLGYQGDVPDLAMVKVGK